MRLTLSATWRGTLAWISPSWDFTKLEEFTKKGKPSADRKRPRFESKPASKAKVPNKQCPNCVLELIIPNNLAF